MSQQKPFKILLNDVQAKKFARAILSDIAEYVEKHREELELLLNEKTESEVVIDMSA